MRNKKNPIRQYAKLLVFLFLVAPSSIFAQEYASTQDQNVVEQNEYIEHDNSSSSLFLQVDFDESENLLTILTKESLESATITILTANDEVIHQESDMVINNHYLLSINEKSPEGVYYIYVEEGGEIGGIWIERFVKKS